MSSIRNELRRRLEESHAGVLAVVTGWDDTTAALPITPQWTAREVLAHLAAAELGHNLVIRRLLAGEPTELPGFDLDAYNQAEVAARQGRSLAELIAEYRANRAATLALLDTVSETDWDKGGLHPGGFATTVAGTFRVIVIHEQRHLRELRAALTAQKRQG